MTYTKQQLEQMDNWEISIALCELLDYKVELIHPRHKSEFPTINVSTVRKGETVSEWFAVEFGRWDCIMPLAVEYGISTMLEDGYWCAMSGASTNMANELSWDVYYTGASPQRAIACCLVLVLQEKKK